MNIIFLVARIVLGAYYLFNAMNHFSMFGMMAGYVASKGVPAPELAVVVSGLLLLVGGTSIITGYKPTIGITALVVFLVPVTFIMHNFWVEQDQMMQLNQMVNFLKNIALMASTVMFLAIPQPWTKSLGAKKSNT